MSSLATQLAARNTLDSARLATSQSLKHPPSFIYSPRHAANVSTSDLHHIASNAYDQLIAIDPFFERYQQKIFGEEAKRTDRAGLTKDENEKLDIVLEKVMRALGRHMLLKPAGVVLEWLVRRFRVNDLNVAALIALFLPYHTTSHFPSALTLIPEATLLPTPFTCLIPTRLSLAPLPHTSLISFLPPFSSLPTARPFLDFLLRLPLSYLTHDEPVHRPLTSFWLQTTAAFLERAGPSLPEGERTAVLAAILETLQQARSQPDVLIASYILLARYSLHHPMDGETLRVTLKTVVANAATKNVRDAETDEAFVTAVVVVAQLGEGEIEVPETKKLFGASGWKTLMRVENLGDLLVQLCNQYDAARFMKAFLEALCRQALFATNNECIKLLKSLLTPRLDSSTDTVTQILPTPIVSLVASSALTTLLSSPTLTEESTSGLITVLNQLYQRWPVVWESTTCSTPASDALHRISNRVLGSGLDSSSSLVLSNSSPDATVRITALKELLSATDLQSSNPTFVHDALLARLAEPVVEVSRVVLAPNAIQVLQASLTPDEILNTLRTVLATPKLDEAIYEVVLPYLSGPYLVANPSKTEEVVKSVLWNRLLSRKGASKERAAVALALQSGPASQHAWLTGVGAALASTSEPTLDQALASHAIVVQAIATNLAQLAPAAQALALSFLLSTTSSTNTDEETASLLSLLVFVQLVAKIEPTARLTLATDVFATLELGQLSLDALTGAQPESLLDKTGSGGPTLSPLLAQAILTRPHNPKTLRRVRAALISATVAALRPLPSSTWTWLATPSTNAEYRSLGQTVYALAHTGTTAGAKDFARDLLSSVFTTLAGDDALAFLAAVWTDERTPSGLRTIALRDAKVFVEVQAAVKRNVDFQTLVPAAVVALMDRDKNVRAEAIELLDGVKTAIPKTATEVYGRDAFYGLATSSAIKYLDVTDLSAYLTLLLASRVELAMDGSFLSTLHSTVLSPADASTTTKKSTSLKLKAYTFLISHATAWTSVPARTTLLRSLAGIRDGPKTALVVDVLKDEIKNPGEDGSDEYAKLLLQPYEGASRKWLEADEGKALKVFFDALKITARAGSGAALRKEALAVTRSSLFSVVRGDTRFDLFKRLISLATTAEPAVTPNVLLTLRACKPDVTTITSFLNEVKISIASPVSKGAKRGRTSLDSVSSRAERLPELIIALEAVDFTNVSASHGLLLALFDLLSSLIEIAAAAQLDIQYLGQLILSTLSKVIENVQPSSGVTNDSIRMAPVLDFMRSSANPQTSHQALLLLAQLGPLVPDQLVHNIMPIFTFMGANVLQRDDAYSLRVVEQTLESILPALVKSMKKSTANRDTLVSDLKDLLRVFTDAASHVPRHRRLKLFVRFVETLGSSEFLSAVSMLLLESASPSVDATELPLSVFENFAVDVQLSALKQVIEEVSRGIQRVAGDSVPAPFLSLSLDGESTDPKEQILLLLNFLSVALEAKQLASKVDAARASFQLDVDTTLSELVRSLLDLSSLPTSTYSKSEAADLAAATSYGVQAAVRLMSTQAFSEAVLWLLDLADPVVQASALTLLRTRLPTIKIARRGDISPAVVEVVDRLRKSLADKEADLGRTLETLDVIVASIYADEDSALAKTVPDLITVASAPGVVKSAQLAALEIIRKLSNRLGPRLIPLVAKIIPFTVSTLRQEATDVANATEAIVTTSFQVLEGIFTSIPTFIGSHLDKVFDAALSSDILSLTEDKDSAASKSRALLLSTAAKRIPAKTLYPAVIRLHASLDGKDLEPILGLLDVLNRALRHGKTTDIADNYRPVFKLFLTIFDLRRVHEDSLSLDDIAHIEENALGAFVQFILKLNEQTFRPLFLRTYDWAVIDLADDADAATALTARRTVLYKLIDKLLVQLKSIVVPYYSFMLDQTIELYESFARGDLVDASLWTAVTSSLTKALDYDETGFWTPLRLSKLSSPIAAQLLSPTPLPTSLITSHYHPLIAAFSQALLPHEDLLKAFNTALLMLTRSDDLRTKRGALEALEVVWEALGDGMLGLVPETTPFLSETMEEVEGGVEATTRRLVTRIEEHLGESLESFLEN